LETYLISYRRGLAITPEIGSSVYHERVTIRLK